MILLEDDIPTFSRLQQSMTPPHPSHTSLPPLPFICIFANTDPFYSHLPKEIRAEGRAPTVRAVRLSVCRAQRWHKKQQGRGGKSLFSENTILQSVCLLMTKVEKKKKYSPSVILEKRTFSEVERVGSPSSLGPLNPTSTSPLAERNMQTHFIDFGSFAEKPNWTFERWREWSACDSVTLTTNRRESEVVSQEEEKMIHAGWPSLIYDADADDVIDFIWNNQGGEAWGLMMLVCIITLL